MCTTSHSSSTAQTATRHHRGMNPSEARNSVNTRRAPAASSSRAGAKRCNSPVARRTSPIRKVSTASRRRPWRRQRVCTQRASSRAHPALVQVLAGLATRSTARRWSRSGRRRTAQALGALPASGCRHRCFTATTASSRDRHRDRRR